MASQPVAYSESIATSIPELELLIAEAMDEWKIPGLAIAVVQNGEVALLRAYGLRDVEAGLKVTTDTQFVIGSITKSFASTGLALWWTSDALIGRSRCGITSRNSGCMTPSRPTASRYAICSAIIPGCRAMIGFGCPAICRPRKCWRQCVIWSRATTFAAPQRLLSPNLIQQLQTPRVYEATRHTSPVCWDHHRAGLTAFP
jgi:Beta-lactamase